MTRPLHPTALVTGGNRGIGRAIVAGLKAKGCAVTLAARDEDEGRRASPLLVHIHPLQDNQFVAIQTLLPGIFLPDGMKVEAKGKSKYAIPESKADYAVITRYLDGFANKKPLKAPHHG